ncbi:HD family phosphohydrolase [Lederbergia wuyishanensis]|uniref:Nucleotidyltransferase with HDIG domain n=1 Tax=Lederbergia wuyishanensis TaxID=1347903 RepID=A0ABU0D1H8_9BACI|nr:HD family phosphohydrolase [Lederbergia wuyishanensis]MCJ8006870.1 HD family phosphohydrolase [Lederbergia wuyishanensis]MDQ0342254.1 putative nucleotidyltransferase with HDIG domain [Lederbergia wuyishanensis]
MDFQAYISKIRTFLSYKVFTTLIYCILGLLLFVILFHNVKPETYDIELFSVADKTIRSPKTVEDEIKTSEARENAADQIDKVYVFKKEMAQNRVSLITSIFDFVKDTNYESHKVVDENSSEIKNEEAAITLQTRLKQLKTRLTENVSEDITNSISDQIFMTLLQTEGAELQNTKDIVVQNVESVMNDKIREDGVEAARKLVADYIKMSGLSDELKNVAIDLGKYAIIPNDLYDPVLTDDRKKQAKEDVEPVKILQGQIIVQEGHLIDRETYRQLEMLGLLKSNPTIKPLIGLGIFVILAIGSIYMYFSRLATTEDKKQNYLLLASLIFICSIIIMKIIGLMENANLNKIAYIFPAAMAPMLIKTMINERLALIMTILIASCGSIVFHDGISNTIDIEVAVYILFSGLAGVLFVSSRNERSHILRAGLLVSCINLLLIFFLLLIGGGQFTITEYLYFGLFSVVSGILSSVFTIGLLPFFEAGFGILSTMRLIELSNPNHPLLKKLLTETPGTYHHSVMVANLAEAACEAIGANGLLARVGCYYHDVGKTKRPPFFIENQMNIENPHDRLPPETSKDIIISHATDGAKELRKHKLPREIVDIAEQHHGTSLLKFFYYKAKKLDENTPESEYRYPGPKPQTKEAAVISLADSVEAAVRSMANPTPSEIRLLVHNIAQDKILDGQFNECNLTLKEIELVKKRFCETLNGIFHSRIEYPDLKQQKVIGSDTAN